MYAFIEWKQICGENSSNLIRKYVELNTEIALLFMTHFHIKNSTKTTLIYGSNFKIRD